MPAALLFPGQGSQTAGMLHRLPPGPATDRTLAQAREVLGRAVGPGDEGPDALDGDAAMRTDTVAVQTALVVAGTAVARALAEREALPDHVAGHSAGAFTAAVAAGVLDFADALELVRLRGETMARLFPPERGYGMTALTGLSQTQVAEVARRVREEGHPLYPANLNAPDQVAVSGSRAGLERGGVLAREAGARGVVPLAVPAPAHCPLMEPVTERLTARLGELAGAGRLGRPERGWVGNTDARVLRRADRVAADLARGAAAPVRWHDATTALYERGVRVFVEVGPGTTLTRLAAHAFPRGRAVAVDEGGVDSAALLLRRG